MKGSTVAYKAVVERISPIFRNTEDCLELKGQFPRFGEAVKLTRREKNSRSKSLVCIEVGSPADRMQVVVENPSQGSQPW